MKKKNCNKLCKAGEHDLMVNQPPSVFSSDTWCMSPIASVRSWAACLRRHSLTETGSANERAINNAKCTKNLHYLREEMNDSSFDIVRVQPPAWISYWCINHSSLVNMYISAQQRHKGTAVPDILCLYTQKHVGSEWWKEKCIYEHYPHRSKE